jgi:hypothetical protein
MKKIKMVFLLLIFCLVSCAVDPPTYYFTKNGCIDEIERIELVEYKNESYKMVDTSKDILKFDPEKVVKVETLNNEKKYTNTMIHTGTKHAVRKMLKKLTTLPRTTARDSGIFFLPKIPKNNLAVPKRTAVSKKVPKKRATMT